MISFDIDDSNNSNCDDNDVEDERNEIARSSYAGMLHDDERHQKYYDALRETMSELRDAGHENITTLDIGTGTGILSMMAARAGSNHVIACEMFEPVSRLAKDVVASNNLSSNITVINQASNDLTIPKDLPCKADVLVTEIFDSELLGEGVLPTLRDAHKRLISSTAKIIPSSAMVNLQLIQSFPLWEMNKLNTEKLGLHIPSKFEECPGTTSTHELQISHFSKQLNNLRSLSKPFCITTLDFTQPYQHKPVNNTDESSAKYSMAETTVTITTNGTLHGVVSWWDLVLHAKKNIVLSMQPSWLTPKNNSYTWRDHWMQCVYYLRKPLSVAIGDHLIVRMFYDDYSVWFDVDFLRNKNTTMMAQRPSCDCGLHVAWPRERFALWNDYSNVNFWQDVCLKKKSNKEILVFGETSLLPLVIAGKGVMGVSYVECSEWSSKRVVEELGDFNSVKIKYSTMEDIKNKHTFYDVLIVDPIWSSSTLPWHHLKTWTLLNDVRLVETSQIFPCAAYLKTCIVKFTDLWKVEAAVVNIEGFDLKKFDLFMEDARCPGCVENYGMFYCAAPYAMMEYKNDVISDVVTLAKFEFNKTISKDICVYTKDIHSFRPIDKTCALVSWLDFKLDEKHFISTGLTQEKVWVKYSRQGIVFIPKAIYEKQTNILKYQALYKPENHEIVFRFL